MMKLRSRVAVATLLAAVMLLVAATPALGVIRIYEMGTNPYKMGVGAARLKMDHATAQRKVGGTWTRILRDTNYRSQVVYYSGRYPKVSSTRYSLQVYSNRYKKVTSFWCNSSAFVTTKGVTVGTTERVLKTKYGTALRLKINGSVYRTYSIGSRTGTDFIVQRSTGKVKQIVVRTY